MRNETVWITWEKQRRNGELARALGAILFEWPEIDAMRGRFAKYVRGGWRTVVVLVRIRPRVVFCQNPSIVLASLVLALRPFLRFRVVVDAHNSGLMPYDGQHAILTRLAVVVQRRADITIVSNEGLRRSVEANGGRPFVLPDRIPDLGPVAAPTLAGRYNILFVCSYAADEPYEAVFLAARLLPPDVVIYVTGNHRKAGVDPTDAPLNLKMTGFVTDEEYCGLLHAVDVVMDLTSREYCLVCGAYEAVSVGRPLILSNTETNRRYFNRGCVYTDHDPESIATAIKRSLHVADMLAEDVRTLRNELAAEWETLRAALIALVGQLRENAT